MSEASGRPKTSAYTSLLILTLIVIILLQKEYKRRKLVT